MLKLVRNVLMLAARFLLSLRYRVDVRGLETVRGLRHAIILPNHPGYMDPPLVITTLWPALQPRPMLLASMFHNPAIFWLPKLLDAVEIPELGQASAEARQQAEDAIRVVADGLRAGRNHILWPSGRVYRTRGRESLGAARSLAQILQAAPEAQVIAVRTRGLWGSMFTYARTGRQPNLVLCLLKAAGLLVANVLFFMPRRRIDITIERIDRSRLPGLSRERVNPFFDAWYNAPGEEQPLHVSYHFAFGARTHSFPPLPQGDDVDISKVRASTRGAVAQIIAEKLKREPEASDEAPERTLEELGLDSLDRMEMTLEIERRFGFSSDEIPTTVGGLWALAEGMVTRGEAPPAPRAWFAPRRSSGRLGLLAGTMARAFALRMIESGDDVAAADDMSGLVSYRRLFLAATLLGRRFDRVAAPNVGVLLPASVAAASVYFALHLRGKLPVILNWTTGPANLAHAAATMQLTHVITSRRFVDRTGVSVAGAQFIFLEDLRNAIGKLEAILAMLRLRFFPRHVLKQLPVQEEDAPAVVLFTSGSEKAPKAVPLTHRNILSNIQAALEGFHLTGDDCLMGFLPSFHSFGLTVTTVLPILAGGRVVYHPDPTDAAAIARKIGMYRTTLVCATPTFISYILDRCRPGEMGCVRLLVAGAEKCPEALFDKAAERAPNSRLLEGYGITECSPIVAVNREENFRRGSIGLPLANVRVRVVDIETFAPLPTGDTGMLLVCGPSVFPGYIGGDAASPFAQQDGARWYITQDLARLDADGFIWFAGRLKRFLKAGGEMISLPAMEDPLANLYPPDKEQGPRVAVEGIETPGGRRIVLFTTEPLTLRQANDVLQQAGMRGIMRLDEVRRVASIPLLGTGKTDYKVLRQMIQAHPD
jgi:long-chain-fatty-acid--[acyl-carrier-protein] ligase